MVYQNSEQLYTGVSGATYDTDFNHAKPRMSEDRPAKTGSG